jgi:hypothetical protein
LKIEGVGKNEKIDSCIIIVIGGFTSIGLWKQFDADEYGKDDQRAFEYANGDRHGSHERRRGDHSGGFGLYGTRG